MDLVEAFSYSGQRRLYPRTRLRRPVFVISRGFSGRCAMVDVSLKGARLVLPDRRLASRDAILIDPQGRHAHRVRMIWRQGSTAGFEIVRSWSFGGKPSAAPRAPAPRPSASLIMA